MNLVLLIAAWASEPDIAALRSGLDAHTSAMTSHAKYPLTFTDKDLGRIATGAVLKRRDRLEGLPAVVLVKPGDDHP